MSIENVLTFERLNKRDGKNICTYVSHNKINKDISNIKVFMSNKWFSNDKKEDDIVIPSFIRLKQQVLTIKMERAIRAMFQKIITTFNFNIDWIDTSLDYIEHKT